MENEYTDRIVVSFCIATYNRYEVVKELIDELLSVDSDKFEIVVSDDKSPENIVPKLREINDKRLHVYENEENVGALFNIHEALNRGNGKYVFYVHDRDNVDITKVHGLIEMLEDMEKRGIAFGSCIPMYYGERKYQTYKAGEEALIEFACDVVHPTGYFFKREYWRKLRNKEVLFRKEKYGDFAITHICAILARKYDGVRVYGDICDVYRDRVDFKKYHSGYYNNRKDKRLWYTPEVQERELKIAYYFLNGIDVPDETIYKILISRFSRYICRVTIQYKKIVCSDLNIFHYGMKPPRNIFFIAIKNGMQLWRGTRSFLKEKRVPMAFIRQIDKVCIDTYREYLTSLCDN